MGELHRSIYRPILLPRFAEDAFPSVCSPRCFIVTVRLASRLRIVRGIDPCDSRRARPDGKWARATPPGAKTCRNVDLCKSRRLDSTKKGPQRRPRRKSVGISTCANRRAGICWNIDLCNAFSCTSRISDRLFSPGPRDGSDTAQVAVPPCVAATACGTDGGQKLALGIDYEPPWGAYSSDYASTICIGRFIVRFHSGRVVEVGFVRFHSGRVAQIEFSLDYTSAICRGRFPSDCPAALCRGRGFVRYVPKDAL